MSIDDPLTETHLLFFTSLCLFTNLFLQRGDPLAHKVFPMTQKFIRKITLRFLTPECYRDVDITQESIDDSHNYLPNAEVFMAFSTQQKLKKLFNNGDISDAQIDHSNNR